MSQVRTDLAPLIERLLAEARFISLLGLEDLARTLNDAVRALQVLIDEREQFTTAARIAAQATPEQLPMARDALLDACDC